MTLAGAAVALGRDVSVGLGVTEAVGPTLGRELGVRASLGLVEVEAVAAAVGVASVGAIGVVAVGPAVETVAVDAAVGVAAPRSAD